jgi:hypothetical protein
MDVTDYAPFLGPIGGGFAAGFRVKIGETSKYITAIPRYPTKLSLKE